MGENVEQGIPGTEHPGGLPSTKVTATAINRISEMKTRNFIIAVMSVEQ